MCRHGMRERTRCGTGTGGDTAGAGRERDRGHVRETGPTREAGTGRTQGGVAGSIGRLTD
jgi:hypothetical protein